MPFLKKFFKRFSRIGVAGVMLATMSLFSFASTAGAQAPEGGTCLCYCGTAAQGAVRAGSFESEGKCAQICGAQKKVYIGCYPTEEQAPENDAKCWTEYECANYATDSGGRATPGTWGGQNAHCVEARSGDATGYCYAPAIPVKLNVPILGRTSVLGLHEYLALAYQFLLPAMSLIAVVMIMVGGLEYVVAGGNSKRLDKAKTRITNALIGLVILMSAYSIAYLLDPRLVNLLALQTPLIKRAVLIDPNATCEVLQDKGFEVSPSTGNCGKQGVIQSIDNVKTEAKNSNFKVGDTCDFSTCSGGKSCVTSDTGNVCLACKEIAELSGKGVVASDAICNQVATRATATDPKNNPPNNDPADDHKYFCAYSHYTLELNQCIQINTPDGDAINCTIIEDAATVAAAAGDPCVAYQALQVIPAGPAAVAAPFWASNQYTEIQQVCESDPCKIAEKNGFRSCKFTAGSNLDFGTSAFVNHCNGVK
jgi:hypothetical protein